MININPDELKTEWVKALRSGEYQQGRGRLRSIHIFDIVESYCCLGVLCDVFQKMTGKGKWTDDPMRLDDHTESQRFTYKGMSDSLSLPASLCHVVGLGYDDCALLEDLNDGISGPSVTFKEIADIIESYM